METPAHMILRKCPLVVCFVVCNLFLFAAQNTPAAKAHIRTPASSNAGWVNFQDPFEHAFTHFTLVVAPWRVRVRKVLPTASQRSTTWLALSELTGAALPSPVRKLLRKL